MSKEKHSFILRYRDRSDNIRQSIIPIPEENYRDDMNYKTNIQYVVKDMYSDGGIWIDELTIIPYHRILSIECSDETSKKQVQKQEQVVQVVPVQPKTQESQVQPKIQEEKKDDVQAQEKKDDRYAMGDKRKNRRFFRRHLKNNNGGNSKAPIPVDNNGQVKPEQAGNTVPTNPV